MIINTNNRFCAKCRATGLDSINKENVEWLNCDTCDRVFDLFCIVFDNFKDKKPPNLNCIICS